MVCTGRSRVNVLRILRDVPRLGDSDVLAPPPPSSPGDRRIARPREDRGLRVSVSASRGKARVGEMLGALARAGYVRVHVTGSLADVDRRVVFEFAMCTPEEAEFNLNLGEC